MSINDPVLIYTLFALVLIILIALIFIVVLLVRKLRKLKTYLYNDELELSAKIEF